MTVHAHTRDGQSAQGFGTRAVHAGAAHAPDGAVIEPISLTTTYAQTAPGNPISAYEYSRSGNPNRDVFERTVASLEHARHAVAFSSGSAATATVLQALAAPAAIPAAPGDRLIGDKTPPGALSPSHVLSVSDVYGGTHRYFTRVAHAHNISVSFTNELGAEAASLMTPQTKLVWIETPSNPTLRLVDIRAVADAAHERGVLVVVDNTFLSPYIQNPLDLGADVVVHSVTKYLNGHSDVVMGVAATNSEDVAERLRFLQNAGGAVPSPFDCWLARRGIRTLHLRAREASRNASIVATGLEASPLVKAVIYPGLDSHPQRDLARVQHRDGLGGGMLSFRIRGGAAAAARFCQLTRVFTLAESLGGVESLVEVPAVMTHAGIPKEEREAAGVFDDLVRVSCGVEDAEDLLADVLQALEGAAAKEAAADSA
jgi:cystathionine gamma-lyase